MEKSARMNKVSVEILKDVQEEMHFSQDFELLYVLDGKLEVTVEEKTSLLGAEDILIINANKRHTLKGAGGELLYMKLMISYQLLSDVLRSLDIIFWCDSSAVNDERYGPLREILKKFLSHYLKVNGNVGDFRYIMNCYELMDYLSVHFLVQKGNREELTEGERFEDRIRQINNYIHSNYDKAISMKDLSDRLYLSNGYLSRFFKKNYGMSFADYLTEVRLYHAVDDLLYTNLPITRIAYDNGFTNEAVFNKAFKAAYQTTPSVYRKNAQSGPAQSGAGVYSKDLEKRLKDFLTSEDSGAAVKDTETGIIRLNAESSGKVDPLWCRMINIGSARELLRSEVREQVLILKKELDFEYVRFWNLFSDSMLLSLEDAEKGYNFSRLDSILDFLLENGLKPHIELSPKPKRINKDAKISLMPLEEKTFLPYHAQWKSFIEHLMQHIVRRYGKAETNTWRMELWMDERAPIEDQYAKMYLDMFEITWKAVKECSPGLELGGFGVRYYYQEEEKLLRRMLQMQTRPDFISLTVFAYARQKENGIIYGKRISSADALTSKLDKTFEILKQEGAEDIKVYITEWNLTVSDRNFINDSCFKGAYIIKQFLAFYGRIEVAAYYTALDRASEYYDSEAPFFGGLGILTKHGFMKPAGYAFKFLKELYPYFLAKGENYMASTDGHGSYSIVCQNMRPLSYNYYFVDEDKLEKENIWKYFEDSNSLKLDIVIDGIEAGTYQQRIYRINADCGSPLEIWKDLGFMEEFERDDFRYFSKLHEPKLTMQMVEVAGGSADLHITLAANEIMHLKLRRI